MYDALNRVATCRVEVEHARESARRASRTLEEAIVQAVRSGGSQREVARSAGVSQPYVSKLVTSRERFRPRSRLGRLLVAKRDEVIQIVDSYGASNVVVFGSVAEGTDDAMSDIDLMVDIPQNMGLLTLGRMEVDLRRALGVKVDVVPARLLKPRVCEAAAKIAVPL